MEFLSRALIKPEKLISIKPEDTVEQAVSMIREHGIRMLPVLEDGKMVGIFSLKSIIREVIPKGLTAAENESGLPDLSYIDGIVDTLSEKLLDIEKLHVRDIMRTEFVKIIEDASATHVLRQIYNHGSPLPVFTKTGEFMGLITEQSMIKYLHLSYWSEEAKEQ